jgi:hypothetical protein
LPTQGRQLKRNALPRTGGKGHTNEGFVHRTHRDLGSHGVRRGQRRVAEPSCPAEPSHFPEFRIAEHQHRGYYCKIGFAAATGVPALRALRHWSQIAS